MGVRLAIAEVKRIVATDDTDATKTWQSRISGAESFVLYDTYGYPIEVTEEVAGEAGMTVDRDGFASEMEAQRERGRAAGGFGGDRESTRVYEQLGIEDTPFVGYETLVSNTSIAAIIAGDKSVDSASEGDEVALVLNETPLYAARGGQVGDTGTISGDGFEIEVTDTKAPYAHLNAHFGTVTSGTVNRGATATATVDGDRRERIRRNHTATHPVHAALLDIVVSHVLQAGPVVASDSRLFEFTNCDPLRT